MSTLCTYMYIATYLLTSDIYISTSCDQCLDCLSMSMFSGQYQGSLSILLVHVDRIQYMKQTRGEYYYQQLTCMHTYVNTSTIIN